MTDVTLIRRLGDETIAKREIKPSTDSQIQVKQQHKAHSLDRRRSTEVDMDSFDLGIVR